MTVPAVTVSAVARSAVTADAKTAGGRTTAGTAVTATARASRRFDRNGNRMRCSFGMFSGVAAISPMAHIRN
ncbi:hypothetical protein GCM10018952_28220 [Streptosporangium vulgare]